MSETTKKFETNVFFGTRNEMYPLVFEYTLFPRRSSIQEAKVDEVSYDEMFLPSEVNDTVLLIDGKKLHVSESETLNKLSGYSEIPKKYGVDCKWMKYHGKIKPDSPTHRSPVTFHWDFNWTILKNTGVERLSGHIILMTSDNEETIEKIDVDFTSGNESIDKISLLDYFYLIFEYSLTPHRPTAQEVSYDKMFSPSDLNDTVLLIDGKKLHVNKVFLSIHSKFFRALFSSNFKEGKMDEIPIQDVSYEDFGLLMSTIYPETVFPNDNTAEKLFELADRFIIPSVIKHVEHHLLQASNISREKMTWMADAYGMPKLLKKCIGELDTLDKMKELSKSQDYEKLCKDTKLAVLDCVVRLI